MELLRAFVLALASAVLAAAVAAPDWTKAELVTVSMVEYRFVPDHLTFRHGTAYRLHLRNDGSELHEFTAPEFLKAIDIGNPEALGGYGSEIVLQPHQEKDLYFVARHPGHYKLICADHDWAGMTGEIAIE